MSIKVLIVDDSPLFREILARLLEEDNKVKVVGLAKDPFEASDLILKTKPDVVICDVIMPGMSGTEFVKRLLPQYFVPVVMMSSIDTSVFEAMQAGAVDFVSKPKMGDKNALATFKKDLLEKIKMASLVKQRPKEQTKPLEKISGKLEKSQDLVIGIGASTGGTEAISSILTALPGDLPPIFIVQHIPAVFSNMFAQRLNNQTNFEVKEAVNGDYVDKGQVVVAPGDMHMRIKKIGGRFKVECFSGERVNGHCPSVDVLFNSIAQEAKANCIGVILTGMGSDGAKGLLRMRQMGARTLGQDQASSVVYGMPRVAYEIGAVERQVSLNDIPKTLYGMLR